MNIMVTYVADYTELCKTKSSISEAKLSKDNETINITSSQNNLRGYELVEYGPHFFSADN